MRTTAGQIPDHLCHRHLRPVFYLLGLVGEKSAAPFKSRDCVINCIKPLFGR